MGKTDTQEPKQFSTLTTYSFTLNYVLGIGILNLPFAFSQAGFILSIVMLMIVSFVCYCTAMYINESWSRAEALVRYHSFKFPLGGTNKKLELDKVVDNLTNHKLGKSHQIESSSSSNGGKLSRGAGGLSDFDSSYQSSEEGLELIQKDKIFKSELLDYDAVNETSSSSSSNTDNSSKRNSNVKNKNKKSTIVMTNNEPENEKKSLIEEDEEIDEENSSYTEKKVFSIKESFVLKNHRFELNDLCSIFLGKKGKLFYTVSLVFWLIGIAWSYSAVVGTTLSMMIPLKSITKGDKW
ncbi:hypothetical protein M0813_10022 [Anaeramoeba flamelloides]|uniref:Amino acid transporter transmembrane domain-containing protein n=1 Tax=Anaeramoeba flamelloides TaxID=1746091 RepID=A0ABQ8X4J9_9EUKA|nr:hypothetical protein M0813_10022 [Anaeramoeba flamelloides]